MQQRKFSPSRQQRADRLSNFDCVPYVELASSKGPLKFLIDTGANRNYINSEHVKRCKQASQPSKVETVNGVFKINNVISFNPFPESKNVQSSEFFVFNFHKFFDGLIGYHTRIIENILIFKKIKVIFINYT